MKSTENSYFSEPWPGPLLGPSVRAGKGPYTRGTALRRYCVPMLHMAADAELILKVDCTMASSQMPHHDLGDFYLFLFASHGMIALSRVLSQQETMPAQIST